MLNRLVISKVCDFILNLRHLGFNTASWEDVLAATGTLSLTDKAELAEELVGAGATISGQGLDFTNLNIDVLRKSLTLYDPLVAIRLRVDAGVWWETASGRVKFVKDPNYTFAADDEGEEEAKSPKFKQLRNDSTSENHLFFDL
jgi:hypothetical protein